MSTRGNRHTGHDIWTLRGPLWRRVGRWPAISLTLALGVLWCLRQWPGEGWWVGVVLVYAPQTIWAIPGGIVVLGALLARDMTTTLCALGSVLLVLFGFMGLQLSLPAQVSNGPVLTVATWNLHNDWRHAVRAREALDMLGVDLALTQEAVDLRFLPHFTGFDCVRSHGQRIFVRQSSLSAQDGPGTADDSSVGLRVLADGPVHLCEEWRLAHEATVELQGRRIDVLDVHFVVGGNLGERNRIAVRSPEYFRTTERYRRLQMQQVARWIQSRSGPWIVAGDFNTPPGARAWRQLPAGARDVFVQRGNGFGYTYRDDLPLWRIDCIWVSPDFRVLDAKVFRGGVSDHLGVWARLELD